MSCQRCLQGFSLVHSGIRQNRVLSRYNNIFSNRSSRLFTVQKTNSRETITKPNFWVRWTAPREMPPRYTLRWYGEVLLICTVFGITGTSTMLLVRPSMFPVVVIHQLASFCSYVDFDGTSLPLAHSNPIPVRYDQQYLMFFN